MQKLGKDLHFPIVVLPVAALLLRLGGVMNDAPINPDLSQTGPLSAIWYIGSIFQAVGKAAIGNLAQLFAIGIGFGMAKDFREEAVLVAFFGWAVIECLMGIVPQWYYNNVLLGNTAIGNFQDNQFWAFPHSQILYVFDFSAGDAVKGYGAKGCIT